MEETIKVSNEFKQAIKNPFAKYYYLDMGDLVSNLFYTFKRNLIPAKEISFNLVDKYSDLLKEELSKKNIEIVFLLSREETNKFFDENMMLYERLEDNKGIKLKEDITLKELITKYHGYLPIEILETIVDPEVMVKVIDMYNEENIKKLVLKKKKD